MPVERALVYVPGGTAPYPSSLIMGVVPAQIAGVKEIYATTPARDGRINPHIAAAALLLGVTDVYRVGGAQAIYAFAYGVRVDTESRYDRGAGQRLCGGGKEGRLRRRSASTCSRDRASLSSLPTEPFPPDVLAWDLFSQAEHDEMATVGLFSPSQEELYERPATHGAPHGLQQEARHRGARPGGQRLSRPLYPPRGRGPRHRPIAPEHLEVLGDEKLAGRIRYAGVTYVGPHTPVAMGDYYIGTNHVLPTGGAGRFSSGPLRGTIYKEASFG